MGTEFEMITKFTDSLAFGFDVRLGPGDGAAVLVPRDDIVIITGVLIRNIYFKHAWPPAFQTGRKAVTANVLDAEAMGVEPSAMMIGLAFPGSLDRRWVDDFQEGVVGGCAWTGVNLVGGDLSSSTHIAFGVTALGGLSGRPVVTRAGARAGDQIAVCGRLGYSAGDLLILQQGFGSSKDPVLEQQCPTAPYGQGKVIAEAGAITMVDVSDGLLQGLEHVCELSGVSVGVGTGALKIHDSLARLAVAMGKDPLGFVLTGGEDHALMATLPAEAEPPQGQL